MQGRINTSQRLPSLGM